MKYLLDTNPCVTHMRGKNPLVLRRFTQTPPGDIALCSVVVAELFYGAERSRNPPRSRQEVESFIAAYPSLPFNDAAARIYAVIRADLVSRGLAIGHNDYLIAAIALANNLTLVTHNTAEFGRVAGLTLEDWEVP